MHCFTVRVLKQEMVQGKEVKEIEKLCQNRAFCFVVVIEMMLTGGTGGPRIVLSFLLLLNFLFLLLVVL